MSGCLIATGYALITLFMFLLCAIVEMSITVVDHMWPLAVALVVAVVILVIFGTFVGHYTRVV